MDKGVRRLPASFQWLNASQFLGALNDNVFKFLIIFLLISVAGDAQRERVIALVSAVFVLPFLVFSDVAGVLADRLSKRRIVVWMKAAEVVIMLLGTWAVVGRSAWGLYAVMFLMCLQSTVFSPAKYGIIPELVAPEQLSRANSQLVGLTYLAIIVGTFIPCYLLRNVLAGSYATLAWVCVAVAVAGAAAALPIRHTPASGSTKRPSPWFLAEIARTLRSTAADRDLLLAILGSAYFMFLGAFLQQNLLVYGRDYLGLDWVQSGYLFPMAAVGIGAGALLSGRLSGRNIEFGIVPLGALGLTLSCFALAAAVPSFPRTLGIVCAIGLSSGLFIVPLNAFIQYRSPADRRGQILACANFLSFLGAALAAGAFYVLNAVCGLTPRGGFAVIGALTGLLAVVSIVVLPDFLVRFAVVVVTRCLYRLRVSGLEHVPVEGPALLVPNHVTWVDALLLSATQQRRIRFLMAREIFSHGWLRPIARLMGAIPISPRDPPRQVVESLRAARQALDDGYLVCIFPEGAITRNGHMRDFKSGFERIVRGTPYPVIPVHIGGAWGSIFSYRAGRLLGAWPRRLPYPVSVTFGAPLSPESTAPDIRRAVQELAVVAVDAQKSSRRVLPTRFIRTARRHWSRPALADSTGQRMTFGRVLAAAVALGRELDREVGDAGRVGVLLPASVGGALVNAALTLRGRTVVNLNFTASRDALESAMRRAGVRTVVSSRRFLQKLGWGEPLPGTVMAEDLLGRIGGVARLRAALAAALAPAAWLRGRRRHGADDVATIIFSSGSGGAPKGVMLSHHNLLSNIEAFTDIVRFEEGDGMCAALPFFHSFGYACTLWCPLVTGFAVHYHPNPLDGASIARMVRERGLTVMLATPTFLVSYARRAEPGDFRTLRLVMTGAEKLRSEVAELFEQRFGVRPLEGYGATELSPVVSVSLPDVDTGGLRQSGGKDGSVGHPVPGVAVRVVDPDSGAPIAGEGQGVLLVKGGNVMCGYLDDPEATAAVLRDGWYDTRDVARVDRDGFIFLLDRLSRFSKIGGEMVSHTAVEDAIRRGLGLMDPALVIAAVPDERKGEQLVALHTDAAGTPDVIWKAIEASGLPNLWRPKREHILRIDAIPQLGSGKLDLQQIKRLAAELAATRAPGAPAHAPGG